MQTCTSLAIQLEQAKSDRTQHLLGAKGHSADRLIAMLHERLGVCADHGRVFWTPDEYPYSLFSQRNRPAVMVDGVCFYRWEEYTYASYPGRYEERLSALKPCKWCPNPVDESYPRDIQSFQDLADALAPGRYEHYDLCDSCRFNRRPPRKPLTARLRARIVAEQPQPEPLPTKAERWGAQLREWDADFAKATEA